MPQYSRDWHHEKPALNNVVPFNTLRPRQNGRHFPDDIFKWIFLNENVWISINISPKFVPRGPINTIPTLVQVMAWRRPGDKPLSEPMMVYLLTHICVARPQWVNRSLPAPLIEKNMMYKICSVIVIILWIHSLHVLTICFPKYACILAWYWMMWQSNTFIRWMVLIEDKANYNVYQSTLKFCI